MSQYYHDLPGSLSKQEFIKQLIRVNQAGEYGAKRIYQGQISVLKHDECADTLKHMAAQEEAHLSYFIDQAKDRQVRPTVMIPVWHVLGYVLGAGTALLGKRAAMACTVAVEEVIDEHYKEQLKVLTEAYPEEEETLKACIEKFRQEELEHRDIGIAHEALHTPGYRALTGVVKMGSKLAIWLSKRI